jgi:ZIP family zinc transporter
MGFSVGVMVAVALAELLPEAHGEAGLATTVLWALGGGGVVALLHVIIPHTHLVDENRGVAAGSLRAAYLVVLGLILHDVPEGFAMANAYLSTPRLGALVAVAMALPAAMIGRRRFLTRAAAVSAAAEPTGALVGLAGVSVFPDLNAGFLAFAAGAMPVRGVHPAGACHACPTVWSISIVASITTPVSFAAHPGGTARADGGRGRRPRAPAPAVSARCPPCEDRRRARSTR